jgi:hypothetical protein
MTECFNEEPREKLIDADAESDARLVLTAGEGRGSRPSGQDCTRGKLAALQRLAYPFSRHGVGEACCISRQEHSMGG